MKTILSILLAIAVWKKFFSHPLGRIPLTMLLAGAIGNLIDRATRGFVVDMLNFKLGLLMLLKC